MRKKLVNE